MIRQVVKRLKQLLTYNKSEHIIILKKEFCATYDETVVIRNADSIVNFKGDKTLIEIGKNSEINGRLIINPYGGKINIGTYCFIGYNTVVQSGTNIFIGNDVQISNNVNIVDNNAHELNHKEREVTARKILTEGYSHLTTRGNITANDIYIDDNVWINFNSIILKGVRIGRGAIVAAGSVVTKDVAPFTLVAGVPAKFVKNVD